MTKDRRLGRGLAALLGTPLEEDGILEGTAAPRPGGGTSVATRPSATMPHASGAQHSSSLVRNSAPSSAARGPSEAKPEQPLRRPIRDSSSDSKLHTDDSSSTSSTSSNTGSVPLANRASSQPMDDSSTAKAKRRGADASDFSSDSQTGSEGVRTLELNVSQIDNNPFQPRRRFNESEIASLAESIREHEQLQPILVRVVDGRYQLISGERRLRATIHAGLTTIRAEVREANDRLVAELAIVENLQRKDLDAIEKAMSFRRYIDEHACTQEDLAKRLKIDRSTIANLIRLLELPAELQTWVQNEKITAGHARSLLPLGDETQQLQFAKQIIEEGWNVRETERRVTAHLLEEDALNPSATGGRATRSGPRKRGSPHLASLEQQLRLSLGTKTEIRQQNNGRGKIVINFSNPEEFERLFALVCPQISKKAA